MNGTTFAEHTQTLTNWFNKRVTDEQKAILFRQLRYIPDEAYKDIVESLIEDTKYFPTISEIKKRYWQWRSSHPEKAMAYPKTKCPDCMGEGLLHIWVKIEDVRYLQVSKCASCENWKEVFAVDSPVLTFSRSELEAAGYEVEPDLEKYKQLPKRRTSVDEMISKSTHTSPTVTDQDIIDKRMAQQQALRKQAARIQQTDEIPF